LSFDGDSVRETRDFATIDEAWDYASSLGSKWYFYPFAFVTSASGKTIVSAPHPLEWTVGMRVKTVKKIFKSYSEMPEAQRMDAEEFAYFVGS